MNSLPIQNLPFFSHLVKDYLDNHEKTESLFSFKPTLAGLKDSLGSKKINYTQRDLLKKIIEKNYSSEYKPVLQ